MENHADIQFGDIDKCLLNWFVEARMHNITINVPILPQKSKDFAALLSIKSFNPSCWLDLKTFSFIVSKFKLIFI